MNEGITYLKRKIVKLEDFFRDTALTFNDKAGLKHMSFLVPDSMRDFSTAFSTYNPSMRVAIKELTPFNQALGEEVFCPRKLLWNFTLWKWIRYFRLIWKIYLYGISAIMPIHGSDGVCCLIVFYDRHANQWFEKHAEFTHTVNQHISFCLASITLYNQTLEGLIRKYYPSHQISANQQVKMEDEQIPTLVERKVEFL